MYSLPKENTEAGVSKRRPLKPQEEEFQKFVTENSTTASTYRKERIREENRNTVTIWDLPLDIKHREIYDMCRKFKEVQIVKVKKTKRKALAVIETSSKWHTNMPWVLPYGNNKLA